MPNAMPTRRKCDRQQHALIINIMLASLAALLAGSLGVHDSPRRPARINNTVGASLPAGLVPAAIVEIDGEPANVQPQGLPLRPGPHIIRARPACEATTSCKNAPPGNYQELAAPVAMSAGEQYWIAVRVLQVRSNVASGPHDQHRLGPWRMAAVPIVLQREPEPGKRRKSPIP